MMPRRPIGCIEDDHETAALIAEELVERGFEAIVAGDGREGFAAIDVLGTVIATRLAAVDRTGVATREANAGEAGIGAAR